MPHIINITLLNSCPTLSFLCNQANIYISILKKNWLFFVLLFIALQLTAQRKNFWLKGYVRDSTELIANAHVVNLTTEKGTFTGDYGDYRIVVTVGDTITVTSVQHKPYKTVITDPIAFSKKLGVVLKKKVIELDEIVLKEHDLTGNLLTDRKKVSKDSIAAMGKNISDVISELADKEAKGQAKFKDPTENGTAAISSRSTDPTKKFKGVGGILNLGKGNKKDLEIQRITADKFTSKVIYDTYGKQFFEDIKVPEKYVFEFIDYCKQFKIKSLYNEGLFLQVAVILKREVPNFIQTLK